MTRLWKMSGQETRFGCDFWTGARAGSCQRRRPHETSPLGRSKGAGFVRRWYPSASPPTRVPDPLGGAGPARICMHHTGRSVLPARLSGSERTRRAAWSGMSRRATPSGRAEGRRSATGRRPLGDLSPQEDGAQPAPKAGRGLPVRFPSEIINDGHGSPPSRTARCRPAQSPCRQGSCRKAWRVPPSWRSGSGCARAAPSGRPARDEGSCEPRRDEHLIAGFPW